MQPMMRNFLISNFSLQRAHLCKYRLHMGGDDDDESNEEEFQKQFTVSGKSLQRQPCV
jgi:hypothetical protein